MRQPPGGASARRPGGRTALTTSRLAAALAICIASCLSSAGANAFAEILELFDVAYATPDHLALEAAQLGASGLLQQNAGLPRFSLEQQLTWRDYAALELSLDLRADVPLYRSRAAQLAQLQARQEEALAWRTAATAALERAQVVSMAVSLALARQVEREASAAARRFAAEVWAPPANPSEAVGVAPQDRDLLALYTAVVGLAAFAAGHAAELGSGLERALGVAAADLPLPTLGATYAALAADPPTVEACLATAPEAAAAARRHELRVGELALGRTTDFEVGVFGRLGYQLGGMADGAVGVRIGVEARVALPDGWPLAGDAGARVHTDGAEQSLRLAWPPAPRGAHALDHATLAAQSERALSAELADLGARATALLRDHADARGDVDAAELRLRWLAVDAGMTTDPEGPLDDPLLELHAVTYRAELAFARLGLITNLLDLQVLCGHGPLGDVGSPSP